MVSPTLIRRLAFLVYIHSILTQWRIGGDVSWFPLPSSEGWLSWCIYTALSPSGALEGGDVSWFPLPSSEGWLSWCIYTALSPSGALEVMLVGVPYPHQKAGFPGSVYTQPSHPVAHSINMITRTTNSVINKSSPLSLSIPISSRHAGPSDDVLNFSAASG